MNRCRACNSKFYPRINKLNNEEESLCTECLSIARFSAIGVDNVHEDDVELSLDLLDLDTYYEGGE